MNIRLSTQKLLEYRITRLAQPYLRIYDTKITIIFIILAKFADIRQLSIIRHVPIFSKNFRYKEKHLFVELPSPNITAAIFPSSCVSNLGSVSFSVFQRADLIRAVSK